MKIASKVFALLFFMAGCAPIQVTPTTSPSPIPATLTETPTFTPSATPTPKIYTLRIEYSTTSDWSILYFLDSSSIMSVKLDRKEGSVSANRNRLSLNQSIENAESLQQVNMVVEVYFSENALAKPIRFQLQKGALNFSTVRFYRVNTGEEILLQEVIRQGSVSGDTDLNRYNFSFDPKVLRETSTITPTTTPAPLRLAFEEDFVSDSLGWDLIQNKPPSPRLRYTYGEKGLEFLYKGYGRNDYYFDRKRPIRTVVLYNNFDLQVVFDRRVRFSGIWLSNDTLGVGDGFYIMIEQGQFAQSWEKEEAHLGIVLPNQEFRSLGIIEDYIKNDNGEIQLRLSFDKDQMDVSVNESPAITYRNSYFSGTKYFMGFAVGARDNFLVKDLEFWTQNGENYEIVDVAEIVWQNAASAFDAMLSQTPISLTSTSTPVLRTPLGPLTINDVVGNWRNIDSGTSRTTRITITREENKIIYHSWGRCHPSDCDQGVATTIFEGDPIVLFRDAGFSIEKIIITREGNLLHIKEFSHYTDNSGRADGISEDYFRK